MTILKAAITTARDTRGTIEIMPCEMISLLVQVADEARRDERAKAEDERIAYYGDLIRANGVIRRKLARLEAANGSVAQG
jgi:hypothetical protein